MRFKSLYSRNLVAVYETEFAVVGATAVVAVAVMERAVVALVVLDCWSSSTRRQGEEEKQRRSSWQLLPILCGL